MTLMELSGEYRENARRLRLRIAKLEVERERMSYGMERVYMNERIKMLETMWREAKELATLMERYYERGYRRNGKYTV